MTTEEAIEILKEWIGSCIGPECDPDREALQMGIDALEFVKAICDEASKATSMFHCIEKGDKDGK